LGKGIEREPGCGCGISEGERFLDGGSGEAVQRGNGIGKKMIATVSKQAGVCGEGSGASDDARERFGANNSPGA